VTLDPTLSAPPKYEAARIPHILIVDDDVDSREMYAIFLAGSGFRVDQAGDAHSAMGHIVTACPDVAVIDIALPGTDGIELCRQIRHHAGHTTPALVALTGLMLREADADRLRDIGLDALLFKPCLPDALATEVRRVLAQSARLQHETDTLCARAKATTRESARLLEDASRIQEWSEKLRRR
jgi:DNA-binding response OmpR family regulator